MDFRHDVLAVDRDGGAFRRAQRNMQDRAVLGDVDLFAAKHRLDSLAQSGLLGQRDEQSQRFVIDAIFRIIEEDAGSLHRHEGGDVELEPLVDEPAHEV